MLVDTNILMCTLQPHHALYALADGALQRLPQQGTRLVIVPQNLIELWAVATRSIEHNGLGLSISAATAELQHIEAMFWLLPDTRLSTRRGRRW